MSQDQASGPDEEEYQQYRQHLFPNRNDTDDADDEWKAFRQKMFHPLASINREETK